jgi:hypothetical protein
MMAQRKLTKRELQKVSRAVWYLRSLARVRGDKPYTTIVLNDLEAMASNGTTDGRPYVEPQPEIGDGYRLATEADKDRRELEFWSKTGLGWQHRKSIHGTPLDPDYHYRVPVDRIPTDDDARQRQTVMVRDNDKQDWQTRKLLAVTGCLDKFITSSSSGVACFWMQARFPYPGELD